MTVNTILKVDLVREGVHVERRRSEQEVEIF